jgi:hypothetical protein
VSTGLKANSDGSAAIQVGGTDVITLTSGGAATFVTSPTTVQAGTAAAPSITFSGDTNTGIYSPGADTIAFTEGGVESARLTSAGNFGLGASPANNTLGKTIQVGQSTTLTSDTAANRFWLGSNWTFDGADKYIANGLAALYSQQDGDHKWWSAPTGTAGNAISFTQIMQVSRNNTLALQGATPQSGTGITFPATQSASSNANTLDDYEEGSFTPTAIGTSTAGTGTYTTQVGKYTKIGNSVQFTIALAWTAHTGTGSLNIAGLPFSASAGGDRYSFSIAAQLLVYTNQLVCINAGGGFTTIELYQQSSNANLSLVAMDGNVTYMVITGTYFV